MGIPTKPSGVKKTRNRVGNLDFFLSRGWAGTAYHLDNEGYIERSSLQCDLVQLQKVFPHLSAADQQLVLWRGVRQLTEREIAEELGISHVAVHQRLRRIVRRLVQA
jgi:DNA-directed RNA polymerase specialized sigma24 family protein